MTEIPHAAVEAAVPLLDRYTPGDAEDIAYDLLRAALPHLLAAQTAEVERLTDRWTDLSVRVENARRTVETLRAAETDDDHARRRLAGKLDGIRTVLSYMDDAERSGR